MDQYQLFCHKEEIVEGDLKRGKYNI
jgi:hypothetical protein